MFAGWARNRKLVTTPKLPPPPRSAQKQVGILGFAGGDEAAIGQHHVGLDQIVDGKPVLAAEIAVAAAQRQPADAGRRDDAERDRQAEGVGGVVDVAGGAARPTRTVRFGSTRTPFIVDRSMTRPSSTLPSPGPLWPPPRMAIGRLLSRPKLTAAMTSADIGAAGNQRAAACRSCRCRACALRRSRNRLGRSVRHAGPVRTG